MTITTTANRGRWAVWLAGLVVVVAAGAATAHGLYEVAVGSRTPPAIAWLYPVITDGLALVAYAATSRVSGPSRRYAWSVVVLAAGLSGLAQATYLAGAVGDAPAGLRFGVGAWPAVAAAIAAHLLFLIGSHPAGDSVPPVAATGGTASVQRDGTPCPIDGVQPVPVGSGQRAEIEGAAASEAIGVERTLGMRRTLSPGDRARTLAELHQARTGALPTVRELADLADVGRGTADRALTALRSTTNGLHVIPNKPDEEPDR